MPQPTPPRQRSCRGRKQRQAARYLRLGAELLEPRAMLAAISGSIWNDLDGDGVRDAGEPPIAGRNVYFDVDNDSVRNTIGAVEPDQYAIGADLTRADPHVTLETLNSSNEPLSFLVTAADGSGYASTGTRVFAHAGVSFFNSSRRLKMTFSSPADRVSIDFAGGASIGTEVGRLEIYNASGTLLNTYLTQPKSARAVERMTLATPKPEIAYAIAYTNPTGNFGVLDNLTFSAPETFVVTAADGSYQFTDLAAGSYAVRQEIAAGMVQTAPMSTTGRLFAVDEFYDDIYELNPQTAAVRRSFAPPVTGSDFSGLAFDGQTLYYLSDANDVLYELNPDTGAILDSTQLPTKSYEGLATLGGLVYAKSTAGGGVDVFDPVSDTIVRSFSVTGFAGANIADGFGEIAGPNRLLARGQNREMLEIDPATGAASIAFVMGGTFSPKGLTSVGQEIFAGDYWGELRVYSRAGALLRTLTGAPYIYSLAGGLAPDGSHRVQLAQGETASGRDFATNEARPWHNIAKPLDTSGDGKISAVDAVTVINYLNGPGGGPVPTTPPPPESQIDVDGDSSISPTDAVLVINYLNAFPLGEPAEGESPLLAATTGSSSALESSDDDLSELILLLALDCAEQPIRRRR